MFLLCICDWLIVLVFFFIFLFFWLRMIVGICECVVIFFFLLSMIMNWIWICVIVFGAWESLSVSEIFIYYLFIFEKVRCELWFMGHGSCYWVSLGQCLTIHFKKVLTQLLWEMKKIVKTLIAFFFFSFPIKHFFKWIVNQYPKDIC